MLHRLSPQAVARFDRERRLHDSLGAHEGFVPFIDSGESSQGPWFAMPYVPGGTLRERLARGRLSIEDSVRIATKLAQALALAHSRGVVHRDMKPENVLFTEAGDPLVADLGLAKHFEGDMAKSASLSRTGELRGTAGYAPIEQMNDAKVAGPPADVFALGAILFECLAGKPAFEAPSLVELLAKVEEGAFTPLDRARPGTPPWLTAVVEKCLAPAAGARFPDAAALARALVARGRASHGARLPLHAPVLASLVFLVAALVLLAVAVERSRVPPPPSPAPETPPQPPPRPVDPTLAKAPAWFQALEPDERPSRLPVGVVFGQKPREYVNEKDESVLVYVPGGDFQVGPEPRRLPGFFIGKHEVTNYQFASFVTATGYRTQAEQSHGGHVVVENTHGKEEGSYWRYPRGQGALETPAPARYPVLQIYWNDAAAYASWAGLRLPTLDEWQKAAGWDFSARHERAYPWGDDAPFTTHRPIGNIADQSFVKKWLEPPPKAGPYDDGFERAAPVDAFPQSAASCGALEMGGNASEWVAAVYDRKKAASVPEHVIDRIGGMHYALVGGSFGEFPPGEKCRVLHEVRHPKQPREDYGIRVCRSE